MTKVQLSRSCKDGKFVVDLANDVLVVSIEGVVTPVSIDTAFQTAVDLVHALDQKAKPWGTVIRLMNDGEVFKESIDLYLEYNSQLGMTSHRVAIALVVMPDVPKLRAGYKRILDASLPGLTVPVEVFSDYGTATDWVRDRISAEQKARSIGA